MAPYVAEVHTAHERAKPSATICHREFIASHTSECGDTFSSKTFNCRDPFRIFLI